MKGVKYMQELEQLYSSLIHDISAKVEREVLAKLDTKPILDEPPLRPQEVAEYLGINKSTVYQLCKEGQLRGFYIGSIHSKKPVLRIRREDLENYMERAGGKELEK